MELGIGFDELVDDQSEFKSRDRCPRCVRPVKVCLCEHIGFVLYNVLVCDFSSLSYVIPPGTRVMLWT